jgi:hypothetical protein
MRKQNIIRGIEMQRRCETTNDKTAQDGRDEKSGTKEYDH